MQQHGDGAPAYAAARADALLAAGDVSGGAVWLRIARAVDELLVERPGAEVVVH